MSQSSGSAPKGQYSEMREKIKQVASKAIRTAASDKKQVSSAKQQKPKQTEK